MTDFTAGIPKVDWDKFDQIIDQIHQTDIFSLAVCVPSTHMVHMSFSVDLFAIGVKFGMEKIQLPWVKKQKIMLFNKQSSLIHSARQLLVLDALQNRSTHILFIDSDQTFPPDLIHRLAKHDKMVVACNIPTREIPARPTAVDKRGNLIYTDPHNCGLQEVGVVGCGIMLVNTKVFKKIRPPLFLLPFDEERNIYIGEDIYFCNKLREAGIPIFIDHDASKKIGHMGQLEFTHAMVGEKRKVPLPEYEQMMEAANG